MKSALYRIAVGTREIPVRFVRNRKARRYILRLIPGGLARVTIPRGGSVEFARHFAQKNASWLQKQLQRSPPEWGNGTEILFRGTPELLELRPGGTGFQVRFAGMEFGVGTEAEVRPVLEERLRALATGELVNRTVGLAAQHGLELRSVRVRDQRSRWGSCSIRKTLSLNWRLVQTPEFVRDYIIIHELMHLKEMNHSPKFWDHVAAACPAYHEAERWLRRNARILR